MQKIRTNTILGLTPQEEKVLAYLGDEHKSVAEIARATHIPRRTLDYLLPRLKKQGWVKTIRVGKRIRWAREAR